MNILLEKFKARLIKENISDVEKIIDIAKDYFSDDNEFIKKTVNDILRYVEKKYQKKYGQDEILVAYPIPAKIRIKIADFKKKNDISYEKYCKFGEWLIEIECKGDEMTVFKLIDEKLYHKFQAVYKDDKEIIEEKKKIINPKNLRFRLE